MNNFLDEFKNTKIAVICDTEEKAFAFMNYLKKLGCLHVMSEKSIHRHYEDIKDQLAYCMYYGGSLSYCRIQWYIDDGFEIIDFYDLINRGKCNICSCYNTCNKEDCKCLNTK